MKTKVMSLRNSLILAFALSLGVLAILATMNSRVEADGREMYEAKFNASGEMIRPEGWREWIYVGTPLTPNSLNPPAAPFPEFHSVYIDPKSWAHYKKTGRFREGTMLAKELAAVGATQATSGKGFFMGELIGFEIAYKSKKRFPDEPGNWPISVSVISPNPITPPPR